MKTRETTPGKTYSVHTMNGCTIIEPDGWQKTIEAPDGYFNAHFGSVVIEGDDEASIKELFNSALIAFGGGGNNSQESYIPIAYLETTGTQWIDTGIVRSGEYRARFEYTTPPALIGGNMFGWIYTHNGTTFQKRFAFYNTAYFGRFAHYSSANYILPINQNEKGYDGTARNVLESTSDVNRVILNGENVYLSSLGASSNVTNPLNAPISLLKSTSGVKVFSFTIFNDSGRADIDLIPILDTTGEPCMFDSVTRKPVYNAGTGAYIAGVETQNQLNYLLRKLPDRTGQDVGILQVRLAAILQTEANEEKLDAMLAKNWEITQAV